ncbi:MAG: FimB/Mfa2 family fimbrial subunit [Clostridium sp.]|nr:FimB/Mfa2 family fimbrial subunit [Clostridium sp.]
MFSRIAGTMLSVVLAIASLSSCSRIFEDLEPCPHGVSLRFVYDYNMEYANSFPKKVDCLTLLIYDEEGNYIDTRTVTGPELGNESYRMKLDLEEGTYRFVAYGGMACDKSSFSFIDRSRSAADGVAYEYLNVGLKSECLTTPSLKKLHDLYWGELTLRTADLYTEGTVELRKQTNNLRIVLQQTDGGVLYADDFDFEITDDNTLFDHKGDLLVNGDVTYTPWTTGEALTGVVVKGDKAEQVPVGVAFAELSMSRFETRNDPTLVIRKHETGEIIIQLPLKKYLLLMKSEHYAMDDQEYLDRESDWVMFLFLRGEVWLKTQIVINDWVVRINNAGF